jgi:hypothetical protein
MGVVKRVDYYFDEPGLQNTESVFKAVKERIEQTGIRTLVIASDSGDTAVKLCDSIKEPDLKIIAVSWKKMSPENVHKLKENGVEVVQESHSPLSGKEARVMAYTYYTLGQGFKVAVELAMITVDMDLVKTGQEVISIAGTTNGADTAVLIKASSTEDMIGQDTMNRLEVKEIVAMPRVKKWWD